MNDTGKTHDFDAFLKRMAFASRADQMLDGKVRPTLAIHKFAGGTKRIVDRVEPYSMSDEKL